MPIRDRIVWGTSNPFTDLRLIGLDRFVRDIRRGSLPANVKGGSVFKNELFDLPVRPHGHYWEYDIEVRVPGKNRGTLRVVLGLNGEVYITGNHYRDFRQVINMPS